MSNDADLYANLGVDAGKAVVRAVFEGGIRNDFPGAFINIAKSKLFPGYVSTQHGDGDGSKSILRMLMYFMTDDPHWFSGMADDGWSMNFSDVAAGGFVKGEFMVTDIINLNAFHVPKETILRSVSSRIQELLGLYDRHGFGDLTNNIVFLGGETADLPRQVQTSVFDVTVSGYMPEAGVVKGDVRPGDQIWGFESGGQAIWEDRPNSGIMSNGLTLAINTLIHPRYGRQYINLLPAGIQFQGRHYHMNDVTAQTHLSGMDIARSLLSPTRQWAILIKILIDKLCADNAFHLLHGISINTGGGATKVKHVGIGGITYHKHMPTPSDIFDLIQLESGEHWRNMYRTFNCGVGIDVIGDEGLGPYLKAVERETNVRLYELGHCEKSDSDKNRVILETLQGTFHDY